ncbi:archaeosortase A [Natronolimnohabitans sp. A-GB9]|uniref:archaeosortase A n=1 Tax=Natronolimnohabitans sp. A-GB9 TaxID=3069757 RepID=UPI0027B5F316|nr:archaeosortase A [Natronolimnohabitans sp. A-GB9]MDQ2051706.1 archaeosortase A [Natronolimnohabitans sp. A-GB9]
MDGSLIAWAAIGLFLIAIGSEWQSQPTAARRIAAGGWLLFGTFWLTMVPYYYGEVRSPIQTVLALAAFPLSAYVSYLQLTGQASLSLLTRAVAVIGLIYLPAETIPFVRQWLIETTARQTHWGLEVFDYSPGLNDGPNGYESRFNFDPDATVTGRTTYIVMACTGLGSMAIFGGLIAATTAPLKRKVVALIVAVGIIWFLNLTRNVFIVLASPWGWFQYEPLVYVFTTYLGEPASRTSYLVAHTYISQPLSVVALIGITYLVFRILPETASVLEELLYVLTGKEIELQTVLKN